MLGCEVVVGGDDDGMEFDGEAEAVVGPGAGAGLCGSNRRLGAWSCRWGGEAVVGFVEVEVEVVASWAVRWHQRVGNWE